jgi:AraC-like DNA-binding protein
VTTPAFWRLAGRPDLLFGRGVQSSYAVEPRGEYFVGLILGRGFRARRGRDRMVFQPGDLGVWDPSGNHAGSALEGAWECRLLVLEPGVMERMFGTTPEFPDPVVRDRGLAAAFYRLHRASVQTGGALARDTAVLDVLHAVAARSPSARARHTGASDLAVRRARDYLHEHASRNVNLAELAEVAEVSEPALARAFRRRLRVPPHGYHLGVRLALARRLLERGVLAGDAATCAGFHDQSHLHRHFVRNFGITPTMYARAATSGKDVQDRR